MIKAILLDCDGVLIDSEYYYLKQTIDMMNELGLNVDEKNVFPVIGTSLQRTCEILGNMLNIETKQMVDIYIKYFEDHPIPFGKIIKENVIETLIKLRKLNIKLAICSAAPMKDLNEVIKQTKFDQYVDFIISGDQLTESKPSGQIYTYASEILGSKPCECIVIEDSSIGIEAGKNANMLVLALHDDKIPSDQSMADHVIYNFKEILNYLD